MKNILYLFIVTLLFTSCNTDAFSKLKSGGSSNEISGKPVENTESVPPSNNSNVVTTNNINSNLVANNSNGKYPVMTFDRKVHDFGNIIDGQAQETVFNYTNTGDAPLVISEIKSTCGCTVPQWPRQPIPAGGSGEIKVQFDSSNKPGMQNKVVTITANTESKVKKLLIRAQVNPRS